jgi:tetratricopeptide (TPR) repeat protein
MNAEDYDRIHRYLLGEMSPEERDELELACQQDHDLQAAVDLERKVLALVRYDGRKRMMASLGRPRQQRRAVFWKDWRWISVAAVAAAIAILVIVQVARPGTGPQRLADKYFAMDDAQELDDLLRGDPAQDPTAFELALKDYQSQHFQAALDRLLLIHTTDSTSNAKVQFLRGESHYQLGQADSAATAYARTLDWANPASSLHRRAAWHQALALIKSGHSDRAKQVLLQLQTQDAASLSETMKKQIAEVLGAL